MDQVIGFPRYESYKESGFDWLGSIPIHWKICPVRKRYQLRNGFPFSSERFNTEGLQENRLVRIRDIIGEADHAYTDQTCPKTSLIDNGDVIIGMDGDFNVKYWREGKAKLNQRLCALTGRNNAWSKYFYYTVPLPIKVINDLTFSTTVKHLASGQVLKVRIPEPPEEEVTRIVCFLDQKTAEIDDAITKKQRLIELLKEQKAILINQAVTKGLDSDVPMRDSGVEWIGEVPEHWEVKRAKYLFKEIDERSVTGTEELLSVSHMTGVTPRSEKNIYMFMAEDYTGSKLCQKDDLVFNIMWAWMGALGVSGQLGIVSPSYGVYRQQSSGTFNSWYLEHMLRSGQYVAEYNRRSTGLHSSRLRLYSHMFFDMQISIPPKDEQDQIQQHVAAKTKQIDKAFLSVEKELDKLNEFRSILISNAVTGKIKL